MNVNVKSTRTVTCSDGWIPRGDTPGPDLALSDNAWGYMTLGKTMSFQIRQPKIHLQLCSKSIPKTAKAKGF